VPLQRAQSDLDDINRRLALEYPATNRETTTGIYPLRHIVIGKFEQALWGTARSASVGAVIQAKRVSNS
jgi:hypothetical protein